MYTFPKAKVSIVLRGDLATHGLTPPADHCYVKNYSENEGILDALTEAGVVEFTGTIVPIGYVQAHLCRVL